MNDFPENILKVFVAVALIVVVYQAHRVGSLQVSILDQTAEIKEAVVETNEIVKEIRLHNTPYDLNNDYHCLASNIYWEARNQPLLGRLAVAQVTQNRVDNERYPDTICNVVKQTKFYPSGRIDLHSCQFSWYCDGVSDIPLEHELDVYEEAFYMAVDFIENRPIDVTEGSTHYHNTKVSPSWSLVLDKVVQIEEHIFYRQ